MFADRTFRTVFIISLCAHGIILSQRMNFNLTPNKNKTENLKISYVKTPAKDKSLGQNKKDIKQEPFFKLPLKITAKAIQFEAPPAEKTEAFNDIKKITSLDSTLIKPTLLKPDISSIKKKITLSPPKADINKIKDPSYISYSQISREKIKRALYQNYGDSTVIGIIDLAFVVSKDGSLKDVHIIDNQSSNSLFLREIALRSVKEAAPFPDFPGNLDYNTELPFSVEISFEKLD